MNKIALGVDDGLMDYPIQACDANQAAQIHRQLAAYNREFLPPPGSYAFVINDPAGDPTGEAAPLAGVVASREGNCLNIHYLFVAAAYRGRGYGAALLRHLEQAAQHDGCEQALVSTFSFQAPGFYAKQGYRCFAQLADCPRPHQRYFFRKDFLENSLEEAADAR